MVRFPKHIPRRATKLAILVLSISGALEAQTLTATPTQLSFVYQIGAGSTVLPQQAISIGGTSGLGAAISVSYPTPPPANWLLQPSPNAGTTPFTTNVTVITTGLPAGTYAGTLTVAAQGATPVNIAVQLIVSNQPLVSASPSALNFAYAVNGPDPAAQTLSVNSTTQGIGFSAAASTTSGVPWLSVNPTAGTTAANLSVTVNRTGLAVGTHTGTITIAAAGAANPQVTVPVSFIVTDEIRLTAVPATLQFDFQLGGPNPQPRTISLTSAGVPVPFTAAVEMTGGGTWLSVNPGSGNTPANLSVSVNPTGLAAGTYNGLVRITSGAAANSPLEVPVTLRVSTDPILQLNPSNFQFTIQTGGTLTQSQVAVLNNLGAALPFTAAATTTSGGNWLSIVATAAATPSALQVQANAQGLAAGTYQGQIAITAAGAANSPFNIPVTLVVTPTPALRADRRYFQFAAQSAQPAPGGQVINVTSTGTAVAFTTTVVTDGGGNWLTAQQASAATPSAVNLSVNPAGLNPGLYTGTVSMVTAQEGATPITAQVRLVVSQNPLLVVSNAPLRFSFSSGGGQPENQSLAVASTGTALNFTEEDSTSSAGDWLVVGPASGVTPATLGVGVNTALPLGNYTGVIRIAAADAANSPQYIPVLYAVSTSAELAVTPSLLSFSHVAGGQAPASQTLNVASTGTIQNFGVQVTANGGNWLSATPAGGITPQALTITVNPTGLEAGTYGGAITITSATATNSPRIIPVTLTVTRPLPALNVSQTALTFNHTPGTNPPQAQTVQATSSGDPVNVTVTVAATGGNWLAVTPNAGATPISLNVSVNPAGLNAGTYTGTVTVSAAAASNSPRTINVTLVVAAVATPVIAGMRHAASFATGPIAPGLIVTLFGTNIGPPAAASGRVVAGRLETLVGETRVLFDNVAAPIVYASGGQTSVVVPYEVAGRVSSRLQVEYRGVRSDPSDFLVVDGRPGIFTQSQTGTGLGAIANQDWSTNSPANGAARGSVIIVFATGEGDTTPPGITGLVIGSDLKRPLLPVRARIAGVECRVLYAGSAPGFVSGALQANIEVDPSIPAGTHPIELLIGSFVSQPGVTVVIR